MNAAPETPLFWAVVLNFGGLGQQVLERYVHFDEALSRQRHEVANGYHAVVCRDLPGGGFTTQF